MFHPKHTMYNFDLRDEAKANGSVHSRVLRTHLTNSLESLTPSLYGVANSTLRNEVVGGFLCSNGMRILRASSTRIS